MVSAAVSLSTTATSMPRASTTAARRCSPSSTGRPRAPSASGPPAAGGNEPGLLVGVRRCLHVRPEHAALAHHLVVGLHGPVEAVDLLGVEALVVPGRPGQVPGVDDDVAD